MRKSLAGKGWSKKFDKNPGRGGGERRGKRRRKGTNEDEDKRGVLKGVRIKGRKWKRKRKRCNFFLHMAQVVCVTTFLGCVENGKLECGTEKTGKENGRGEGEDKRSCNGEKEKRRGQEEGRERK